MIKCVRFLSILVLTLLPLKLLALSGAFHQVSDPLTIQSASTGKQYELGHDSFVRTLYELDSLGHWAIKVQLVDEDNSLISEDTFLTSKKYFNKSVAIDFRSALEVLDENNEVKKVEAGTKLVRLADVQGSGWDHYRLIMVNENGEMIDWHGNVTQNPPILKTSMSTFNNLNMDDEIKKLLAGLVDEKEEIEESGAPLTSIRPLCRPSGLSISPTPDAHETLKNSPRPKARPERLSSSNFWKAPVSPYQMIMDQRDALKGSKSCQSRLRSLESALLNQTSWGGLSLNERATKIKSVAQESLIALKEVSIDGASRNRYASSVNPNYLSPIITSDLAACIAFQETSGHLNPFSQNYTYCDDTKGMISTAHGLGQMTRGTFRKMKNHPERDQLPYSTEYSKVLQGKDYRSAHTLLSTDPHLQMEVIFRLLNFELKYAKWKNPKASADELMKMAVTQYDHDNKSKYVKNVFDRCVPCMKEKSAGECYESIWP